jgi:D-psicose/D-tagatose/L-ribulose 3-epimerase
MPVGFNLLLWTDRVTPAHAGILRDLQQAGYDGVEVPLPASGPEARMVAGMLDDLGLRCTASTAVTDPGLDPVSADPATRARAVDDLRRKVDIAAELGAEVLCGPFTQVLGQFSGAAPTPAEWDRLEASQQAMAEQAAGRLVLAVEPLNRFEAYMLNTAADAARLVAAVGRPGYGYLYDTFHANIEERDPKAAIAATAPAIAHVHLSENDRGTPGRGHVDFAGTLTALEGAGYQGWLTFEAFGQALAGLSAATRIWRPLFGSETEVYTEAIALVRRLRPARERE